MSKAKTYSEKFKDPRWQKMRLKVLDRDEFKCRICGDKKNTLHVHHLIYFNGHDPWDYEDNFLITLCANCHNSITVGEINLKDVIVEHVLINGIDDALRWFVDDPSNFLRESMFGYCGIYDAYIGAKDNG